MFRYYKSCNSLLLPGQSIARCSSRWSTTEPWELENIRRPWGLRQNTLTWNLGKYCPVRPRCCLDLRRQLRRWQVAPRASSRSSCRGWEGTRTSDWLYSPESRDRQLQVTSARTVPLFDMRSTIFTTTRDVAMAENVESSLESVATRLLTHISTSTRVSSAFRKMSAQCQCCRGGSC